MNFPGYPNPYPNSHLTAEDRLALYLGQLNAAAKVQADHRARTATMGFEREPCGLVHLGEDRKAA